ncbi:Putative protein involved in vacuolar function [Komagataella phaffii CBS 7435]|uniref:Protein with similarity to oxidoreductases, found in lipid particles n=2 Tax=Komagataella phaffii TaxID=460519 RepID=C4R7R7_KOMPG|nr:uncharacterized protein PAS_chr4_0392 [Komagataella phaffii GS115]AOA64570.1 GQ67_04742T0 [Komagataella phaffii]CAH2450976.1 Putative protein involved in vacuolar function [Komagataella phaffii CBS 7435]AOA69830.1 GQ68_04714T0 [Komagataella phaffii GS115]CAY71642.1 Protein with similarity to oxidoreductases, found in lipid particles [Komagataella phaffii GS115]CCA40755.1 Putative protein involved in vacuolar function [Komagataella phaffii CBS 7435]
MSLENPNLLPYFNPKKERRVAFITGANSGIGQMTTLHLYMHGYIVYMAGRSKARVDQAIKFVQKEARHRRWLPDQTFGELKYIHLDLMNLKSVERAVVEFKTQEKVLHLLINNAGVMALPFYLSGDKFEVQMQTDYVAPFLLTQRLVPLMETVSDPRIIYLSSIGHNFCFRRFSPDSQFVYWPNIIFTWFRYGLAKTAGILYMKTLAIQHPNILCLSVHPGFVMNTNLFSHFTRLPLIGTFFWLAFQVFGWIFGVSNEDGSYSTVNCALSPKLSASSDNGKYFTTYGIETTPNRVARDLQYGKILWDWTQQELLKRGYNT